MEPFQEIGSTNPNLISMLRNIDERFAWITFITRYRPMIRKCMLDFKLNAHEREEVEAQVMLCLVKFFSRSDAAIQTSFRGFLAKIVENETCRFLREKINYRNLHLSCEVKTLAEFALSDNQRDSIDKIETDMLSRLKKLNIIIDLLKISIAHSTWEIYWDYSILEMDARDVAAKHGVTVSAVYKYQKRVTKKLREIVSRVDQTEQDGNLEQ